MCIRDRVSALRLVARSAYLAALFAPLVLASPLALLSARCRRALLRLLVATLSAAGPCAVKLGQWASTRPDLLPRGVCDALSTLHEGASTHSFAETEAACEEAFGVPARCVFRTLSREPVGSGCIAQVHAATLLDGRRVAVKVLHPHAARTSALDLALIRLGVRAIDAAAPLVRGVRFLALRGAADNFEEFMLAQLDLRVEASNLERFARNFALDPVSLVPALLRGVAEGTPDADVRFPTPVDGLVTRGVLVETYAEGHSLSSLLAAPDGAGAGAEHLDERRRRRLARAGLRAFLQMLLVHNFVHADLHPGNILVAFAPAQPAAGTHRSWGAALRDGWARAHADATPAEPRTSLTSAADEHVALTFIDAGLTVELSPADRLNFLRLFNAIVNGDGRRAGALMLEHARESDCDDPAAFEGKIEALVQQTHAARRGEFTLSRLDVGRVLYDVLSAVREHRVMIEPNFTTLVSSIAILEGLGRQLDAELDLFTLAVPLLAKLAASEAFSLILGRTEAARD